MNFECGHIVSVKEGGETNIENLLPICSSCNKSMGTENLMVFKKKYFSTNPDIPKKETKNIQKEETKPKTPIEEFVESKVKYNDELVDEELDNPSNRASDNPYGGAANDLLQAACFPKIKTGRKVPREVKLETVYNHYRNWISVHYPQIHKDTQFEGCFGDNDTQENIEKIITHKYGEPINMANWSISSEMGGKITGWKNVEIID